MRARLKAELNLDSVGSVDPGDARGRSFVAVSDRELLGIESRDLEVVARWSLPANCVWGGHSADIERGLAVIGASDHVALLERDGTTRWEYEHPAWTGDFESGCTWLTADSALAVFPTRDYDGCDVARLDLLTGRERSAVTIEAFPAGITPIYHPDGWIGLSVGEGQDAAKAWWVRAEAGHDIELFSAGWADTVLSDAAHNQAMILTTGHVGGPLTVRSFPDLRVERQIDPPPGTFWDFGVCFVGELIVARLLNGGDEPVAIHRDGTIHPLDISDGWLVPARDGFLTVQRNHIRRWELE